MDKVKEMLAFATRLGKAFTLMRAQGAGVMIALGSVFWRLWYFGIRRGFAGIWKK